MADIEPVRAEAQQEETAERQIELPVHTAGPRRWLGPPHHWIGVAAAVFLVDMVVLVRRALTSDVSLWDEGYHLSYLEYAQAWQVPRAGDEMSDWAKELYTCNPVPPFGGVSTIPCGGDGPDGLYPDNGRNSAAGWPPIYYFVVANLMRPVQALGVEPVTSGRLVSAAIWAAGAALLAVLVLSQASSKTLAVSAGVIVGLIPTTWGMSGFVTPHSTALLVGAANVALLLLVWRRPVTWKWAALGGVVLGLLSTLTLPHAIVVVGMVAFAGLTLAMRDATKRVALIAYSTLLGVSGLLGYLGWERIQRARAVADLLNQPSSPYEGIRAAIRDDWDNFWPRGLERFWPPGSTDFGGFFQAEDRIWSTLLMYGSIALVGYWLLGGSKTVQNGLAIAAVTVVPLFAVTFALRLDFPVPPRYGASALAAIAFLLAVPNATRASKWVVAGVAMVTWVIAWLSCDHFLIQVW